jgi:hypothetical protein
MRRSNNPLWRLIPIHTEIVKHFHRVGSSLRARALADQEDCLIHVAVIDERERKRGASASTGVSDARVGVTKARGAGDGMERAR